MTAPRPGMIRFDGNVAVFYVAICTQCQMAIPHASQADRDEWAAEHRQAGHAVTLAVDVRPDPNITELRRIDLIARLRAKYAHESTVSAGRCAGCPAIILAGDRRIQWNGKFWHASCLDDEAYIRMASITDIAPETMKRGPFATMPPMHTGKYLADTVVPSDATREGVQYSFHVNAIDADDKPKKPNARERRRLKRQGKQWAK